MDLDFDTIMGAIASNEPSSFAVPNSSRPSSRTLLSDADAGFAVALLGALVTILLVLLGIIRRYCSLQQQHGRRKYTSRALFGLLMSTQLPHEAGAHNWMIGPRRGTGAGTRNPCARRTSFTPHVVVNRGQPFNIQWSSGQQHSSSSSSSSTATATAISPLTPSSHTLL